MSYRRTVIVRMPPPALQDCKQKTRKLPNWKADQRKVPRGSTETVVSHRYVASGVRNVPCARTDVRVAGKRTMCFSEASPRRKTCPLLSESETVLPVPTGMHLSGKGSLADHAVSCGTYADEEDEESLTDQNAPYQLTVLGPFPHILHPKRWVIRCIETTDLSGIRDLEGLSRVFSTSVSVRDHVRKVTQSHPVNYVPTLPMLKAYVRTLAGQDAPDDVAPVLDTFRPLVTELEKMHSKLHALRRRCESDTQLRTKARRVLMNAFLFGMYARRWQGPGYPYPVNNVGLVGTRARPASKALIGNTAAWSASGLVRLVPKGVYRAADFVNGEGRLEVVQDAYLQAANTILSSDSFLSSHMLSCVETAYAIDGTGWPDSDTLHDLVGLCMEGTASSSGTGSCIRRNSMHIVRSCQLLIPYVYSSPPVWSRYEGFLTRLDVSTRS